MSSRARIAVSTIVFALAVVPSCDPVQAATAIAVAVDGGGGDSPPPPPPSLSCQAGFWQIDGQPFAWSSGGVPSIGLETVVFELVTVPEAKAEGVTAFLIHCPALDIPDLGLGAALLPSGPQGGLQCKLFGVYRDPVAERTVRLHGATSSFDCDSFEVLLDVEVYDGDAIVEVEVEPGVFSWEIAPGATAIGLGTYLLTGAKR